MNDLTLATCSFGTPLITLNMLKSFSYFHPTTNILISENSNDDETRNLLDKHNIKYLSNPGFHHSIGVDVLIDNCKTKYMLLVDTDVIFLKSISYIYEKFKQVKGTICGVVQGDRGGMILYDRVCPWFCFIDIETIRKHNIKYYDNVRFTQHLITEQDKLRIYDVGATFLEDIKNNGLKLVSITESVQNEYIKHFEGMSWRKHIGNDALKKLAIVVEKEYDTTIANSKFKDVLLKGKFIC